MTRWGPSVSFLDNRTQITRCYLESQESARKANLEESQWWSVPKSAGLASMNSVPIYSSSGRETLSQWNRGENTLKTESLWGESDLGVIKGGLLKWLTTKLYLKYRGKRAGHRMEMPGILFREGWVVKVLGIYCQNIWSAREWEGWMQRGKWWLRGVLGEVGIIHSEAGSRSELWGSHVEKSPFIGPLAQQASLD